MGAMFPASLGRRGDHPMTCPFCGKADNPAHAKICSHCGTALLPVQSAQSAQPAQPTQPAPAGESAQASPMDEARATALPGRSRHGFYAGQGSRFDQIGPVHGAVHADPPVQAGRADDARPAQDVQPAAGLITGDQQAQIQALLDRAKKAHSRFGDAKPFWK